MRFFPPSLTSPFLAWRIDLSRYATTWDSGLGAHSVGGRWNPAGVKAVYCSLDAATAFMEVAVHKGFHALDKVPHVISGLAVADPSLVHVVKPADVPNPTWLMPGLPSAGQQAFGAQLLADHSFVAIPSAVSKYSWNLLFDPDRAAGQYKQILHERLSIDTRLNPP